MSKEMNLTEFSVKLNDVTYNYQDKDEKISALQSINISVRCPEIYALVGPSGCGKTTLVKILVNLLQPLSGNVKLFGYKPGDPRVKIPGSNVGYMPQDDSVPSDLTVGECLFLFGRLSLIDSPRLKLRIQEMVKLMELNGIKNQLVGTLSGGEKRRLSLACTLLHKPKLLLLDEPTVACDPVFRHKIWKLLHRICSENRSSIIITTHYIGECIQSHRMAFLRQGQVIFEGEPNRVLKVTQSLSLEEGFFKLCYNVEHEKCYKSIHRKALNPASDKSHSSEIRQSSLEYINALQRFKTDIWLTMVMVYRYLIQVWRDPFFMYLLITLPTVNTALLCWLIAKDPLIPMGIVIEKQDFKLSQEIRALINSTDLEKVKRQLSPQSFRRFINSDVIELRNYSSLEEALEDVRRTKIRGIIFIDQQFAEAFVDKLTNDYWRHLSVQTIRDSQIIVYADLTNRILRDTFEASLSNSYQEFWENSTKTLDHSVVDSIPMKLGQAIYGRKNGKTNPFPATVVMLFFGNPFLVSGLNLLSELSDKVIDRFRSTGLNSFHLIASLLISKFICFATVSLMSIPIGLIVVGSTATYSSILLIYCLVWLQIISGITLGFLGASLVGGQIEYMSLAVSFLYSYLSVQSMFFPIAMQPYYIRYVSEYLPSSSAFIALQDIIDKGFTINNPSVYKAILVNGFYVILGSIILRVKLIRTTKRRSF